MSNPCGGVGAFFAVFWGTVSVFVYAFAFRAGYDAGRVAGYDAGRADASDTFRRIIRAARAEYIYSNVPAFRAALAEFPELSEIITDGTS
jgi:hypothetical protein